MDHADALTELGVAPGDDLATVRRAYHRLLRERHPDVASASATADTRAAEHATAQLIEAYELVIALVDESADGLVPTPAAPEVADGSALPTETPTAGLTHAASETTDEDSLLVDAPPDLTWQLLVDAAARVGNIAYIDRSLQILEIVVRFEGGPSCSVVFTLQGRGQHTEIMCSMASIEAGATPPIAPVVDALVEALTALG